MKCNRCKQPWGNPEKDWCALCAYLTNLNQRWWKENKPFLHREKERVVRIVSEPGKGEWKPGPRWTTSGLSRVG